jgi:hypothetical protein
MIESATKGERADECESKRERKREKVRSNYGFVMKLSVYPHR